MGKYVYNPNLKGKHPAFSQRLFEKYDIPARERIKRVLHDCVTDNPDIYKQDFIINDNECKYKYLEIQVCPSWIGDDYPYEMVTLHERKSCYGKDTLFLTLNHDLSKCHIFSVDDFAKLNIHRIKKYSREYVYDIPWCRVMTVYTDVLDMDTIKLY